MCLSGFAVMWKGDMLINVIIYTTSRSLLEALKFHDS